MTAATLTRPVLPTAFDTPIPFGRLVRVEWRKASDTRSARWLLALVGASTVGLLLAPLLARGTIDQTYSSYLNFAALGLSILLPVVSVLALTTEWSQRTVLSTFTQEPRRARAIGAKVASSMILAGLAAAFGAVVTALAIGVATLTGQHVENNLGTANTIGFFAFIVLNVLMGVAFGALLHNSAAAIVALFALPVAFGLLAVALKTVASWLDPSQALNNVLDGNYDGTVGKILVACALWIVAPLILGVARTVKREIK